MKKIFITLFFIIILLGVISAYAENIRFQNETGSDKVVIDKSQGNVTSSGWFIGLFSWTTFTNWLNFDGETLSFNETRLNDTIDARQVNTSILQGANSTGDINTLSITDNNILQLSVSSINADSLWMEFGSVLKPIIPTDVLIEGNFNVTQNITVEDRIVLGNGASIGYNSTCDIIKWNSSGSVISFEGCT